MQQQKCAIFAVFGLLLALLGTTTAATPWFLNQDAPTLFQFSYLFREMDDSSNHCLLNATLRAILLPNRAFKIQLKNVKERIEPVDFTRCPTVFTSMEGIETPFSVSFEYNNERSGLRMKEIKFSEADSLPTIQLKKSLAALFLQGGYIFYKVKDGLESEVTSELDTEFGQCEIHFSRKPSVQEKAFLVEGTLTPTECESEFEGKSELSDDSIQTISFLGHIENGKPLTLRRKTVLKTTNSNSGWKNVLNLDFKGYDFVLDENKNVYHSLTMARLKDF